MSKQAKTKAFEFQAFSDKQLQLITWWMQDSPYKDYDLIIADGSIRSGKTVAGIDGFLTWSLANFSGEDFIIAGKSVGALKRNVWKPMSQILTAKGIGYNYNRSENYIVVGNNTYYLFGAVNEASQDTLQGLTAAGAYADEVALFPDNFIDQMIGRCSVLGSKVWMNCNPEGPFHYVKTDFIDKAEEKRILHLHFTLDDNMSLPQAVKERYKRMFTGVFYQRYILGKWVMAEGVIYDMFEPPSMIVDSLPDMKQYWVGGDYGTSNPTTFLLLGLGVDDRLYLIDEYYHSGALSGRQKSPSQYAEDFKLWMHSRRTPQGATIQPSYIYLDPSAEGFILELYNKGVKRIARADNSVKTGIELVASVIGNDFFRVHRRCKNTLKEFSTYVWDEKAQERGEDKPLKQNDHCMDALRYVVNGTRHIWFRRGITNKAA